MNHFPLFHLVSRLSTTLLFSWDRKHRPPGRWAPGSKNTHAHNERTTGWEPSSDPFRSCILRLFLFALSGVVSTGFSLRFLLLLRRNSAAAVPLGPTGGSRYWGGIHFCPVSAAQSVRVPVGMSSVVLVPLLFLSVYSSSSGRWSRRRGPWHQRLCRLPRDWRLGAARLSV